MKELEYPFDAEFIIKKKRGLKKELMKSSPSLTKRIAILGGSTTNELLLDLELFLLNQGIQPEFYESEYNQFFQDGFFGNPELNSFSPEIIYLYTTSRNILVFPTPSDSPEAIAEMLESETSRYRQLWDRLEERYHCTIIQNNFEYPTFRLLGNMDAEDFHGRTSYISRLNEEFYKYARSHSAFHICDINYLSALIGLERWYDPSVWHMYKYAMSIAAIPHLAFQISNIIKALCGKNKKALNLDLDNTLWGGVVGDDGAENLEIGRETAIAQAYSEFQDYLRLLRQMGILLTVNSKNDEENARSGFSHPDSVLKEEDFVSFKANWAAKDQNLSETAAELSLLPESFVFVDDNPAERARIQGQLPGVSTPELTDVEHYMDIIDRSGFFEPVFISEDDLKRNEMYLENTKRLKAKASFEKYDDYLRSLEMTAEIRSFLPVYMARIAQLTNKSNQFNLTTWRCSQSELEDMVKSPEYITLYGKLSDRFGDNGVVSVVIGQIRGKELHIRLWLMSCRVLMRDMEWAMMDKLVEKASEAGIEKLIGYYYPTTKNSMVKDFYAQQGFTRVSEDERGNTVWEFLLPENYKKGNQVIRVLPESESL